MTPVWIVCEDGSEYFSRFSRFLASQFTFVRADCAGSLLRLARQGAVGAIIDLDFRRTPAALLVDDSGEPPPQPLPETDRLRLVQNQGIFAIRALRAAGLMLPVILCADLDDAGQVALLTASLAPLVIVGSSEGLPHLAARMHTLSATR